MSDWKYDGVISSGMVVYFIIWRKGRRIEEKSEKSRPFYVGIKKLKILLGMRWEGDNKGWEFLTKKKHVFLVWKDDNVQYFLKTINQRHVITFPLIIKNEKKITISSILKTLIPLSSLLSTYPNKAFNKSDKLKKGETMFQRNLECMRVIILIPIHKKLT